MNNQQGNAQSRPHWVGVTTSSFVKGPDSGESFSISARALNITWGNDPRYWEWIELDEINAKITGFEEAAMLHQVNWLEITGKFELPAPVTSPRSYKVYYMLKFNEDAFGWNHVVIKFNVKLRYNDDHDHDEGINQENIQACKTEINLETYQARPSAWHLVKGGEFTTRKKRCMNVEVGMFEVETEWWKGSMILGGIKLEPNF